MQIDLCEFKTGVVYNYDQSDILWSLFMSLSRVSLQQGESVLPRLITEMHRLSNEKAQCHKWANSFWVVGQWGIIDPKAVYHLSTKLVPAITGPTYDQTRQNLSMEQLWQTSWGVSGCLERELAVFRDAGPDRLLQSSSRLSLSNYIFFYLLLWEVLPPF